MDIRYSMRAWTEFNWHRIWFSVRCMRLSSWTIRGSVYLPPDAILFTKKTLNSSKIKFSTFKSEIKSNFTNTTQSFFNEKR